MRVAQTKDAKTATAMTPLPIDAIETAVRAALREDVGPGDATSEAVIPPEAIATALMVAREPLVVAGIQFALTTFHQVSSSIEIQQLQSDGSRVQTGDALLSFKGPARAVLTGERVALNFVQRLSGVATLTAKFVQAISGTNAKILDTRKTTPGWRTFEKYAVACGGGQNHRFGLFDLILIKDNHLATLSGSDGSPVKLAVERARAKYPQLKVEVEADTLEQVEQALAAGADIILLDNMRPEQLRAAVTLVKGRAKTEASGGINLDTVRAAAETGVDFISVGALTHSARAVDLALDFVVQ